MTQVRTVSSQFCHNIKQQCQHRLVWISQPLEKVSQNCGLSLGSEMYSTLLHCNVGCIEIDIYNFELIAGSLKLYIFISILTSYCQFTIYLTFYSELHCTVQCCLRTKYFIFFFKKIQYQNLVLIFHFILYIIPILAGTYSGKKFFV